MATSASSFCRLVSSSAPGPANRAEYTPGAPPSATAAIPESSASTHTPPPTVRCTCRALMSAFSRKVVPVSSGITPVYGSIWKPSSSRVSSSALCRLCDASTIRIARQPSVRTAAWAAASDSIPPAASSSSRSSDALANGVFSAVACTSISSPLPDMTTFMSTSARLSST